MMHSRRSVLTLSLLRARPTQPQLSNVFPPMSRSITADVTRPSPSPPTSLSTPPYDLFRRSQHAVELLTTMDPLSENAPLLRRKSGAIAALEVLEGLVLDGVFVPQVAVLRMLWLARRANDAEILRRSLQVTAAVGILSKDRQIADALEVFSRSGDVAGFIAAEQDVLQVRYI
jgi:hypothetical protein